MGSKTTISVTQKKGVKNQEICVSQLYHSSFSRCSSPFIERCFYFLGTATSDICKPNSSIIGGILSKPSIKINLVICVLFSSLSCLFQVVCAGPIHIFEKAFSLVILNTLYNLQYKGAMSMHIVKVW